MDSFFKFAESAMDKLLIAALVASVLSLSALAQNCGPKANGMICTDGNCCSNHGWCGNSKLHCDLETCLSAYSDPLSVCAKKDNRSETDNAKKPTPNQSFPSQTKLSELGIQPNLHVVPDIDQCGASVGFTCPGAGRNGYFYRCCSSSGHCGPKNDIQDQAIYCGDGCQGEYGDCSLNRTAPARPSTPPRTVNIGHKCGPIVNARCAAGLCCSGSNFCGLGQDYCGKDNWCQPEYGRCD